MVPVWISLPGLLPNYYHSFIPLLSFQINATACVTRPEAARICVEMDVSKPLWHHFWLCPRDSSRVIIKKLFMKWFHRFVDGVENKVT